MGESTNASLGREETTGTPEPVRGLPSRRTIALISAGAALVLAIVLLFVFRWSGRERRQQEELLKATLDKLVTAQEGFYYDSARYVNSLKSLPSLSVPARVRLLITTPNSKSWWASATDPGLPRRHCVVWVGTAPTSLPAAAREPENETKPLCFADGPDNR